MAKARRLAVNPAVRGTVRGGVRGDSTDDEILSDIQAKFPNMSEDDVRKMIKDERRIQGAIAGIQNEDKRSNVDLARRLKCPAGTKRIRVYMSITFPLGPGGKDAKHYTDTVEIDARGRLSDLINDALSKVINNAVGKGYNPPAIRSVDTTGRIRYRIERMDCV